MNKWIFSILLWPFVLSLSAQEDERTVGLMLNNAGAYDAYTLFSPSSNSTTYLINNCGELVHSWTSDLRPGNAVYLEPDGSLWRAGRLENRKINAGGGGGIIQKLDWDSNVLWSFTYNNDTVRAHHDFQVLPNGNVLILAWELRDFEESLANGRNPEILPDEELWPDQLIEIRPEGTEGGTIVWQWNAWDHMIQDFDADKLNYGVVADHPEKIDINYIRPDRPIADWHHANSVHYNPELDQIMLSVLHFDEIWIIDHNTTTEEASGPKGDLVYRWGNPKAYKKGTASDQQLFGQHNAQWITQGTENIGEIIIFNNGKFRPELEYSSAVKIKQDFANGTYQKKADGTFAPETYSWEYSADPLDSFYSRFISGAQQLPNDNILITDGAFGRFFEINPAKETVWEYVNPITVFGVAEQGINILNPAGEGTNTVFRSTKYPTNYQAFVGKDLAPKGIIEIDLTNTNPCSVILASNEMTRLKVYPNPSSDFVKLVGYQGSYTIRDVQGRNVRSGSVNETRDMIDIHNLNKGVYFLQVKDGTTIKLLKVN